MSVRIETVRRKAIATEKIELPFHRIHARANERSIRRTNIIIVQSARKQRRLTARYDVIGIGNEAEPFDKEFHNRKIVFSLLFSAVYEQSQIGKIRVPVKEPGKERTRARRTVRSGHTKTRTVGRAARLTNGTVPIFFDIVDYVHVIFSLGIRTNAAPPAESSNSARETPLSKSPDRPFSPYRRAPESAPQIVILFRIARMGSV